MKSISSSRLPTTPLKSLYTDIGPVEAAGVVLGITEVIDFVTGFSQRGHHFGLVWVPPAGGDVDFGHGIDGLLFTDLLNFTESAT